MQPNISYKKTQKQIALFFAIAASILLLITGVTTLFLIRYEIDRQAKITLEENLTQVTNDFNTNQLKETEIAFQSKNSFITDEKGKKLELPNIGSRDDELSLDTSEGQSTDWKYFNPQSQTLNPRYSAAVDGIDIPIPDIASFQADKRVFSRVILPDGGIQFTSDLFEANYINPNIDGFKKTTEQDICIYSYTEEILEGANEGSTVQVAQYCAFTVGQQNKVFLLILAVTIIASLTTYFVGLIIAKKLLEPLKKSTEQTRQFAQSLYHELLTPISVALSTADSSVRTKKYKQGIKSVLEDLTTAQESMNMLNIETFEDFSKSQLEKLNISQILLDIIEENSSGFASAKLRVDTSKVEVNIKTKADLTSLKLIFKNLISNLIKYSKQDSKVHFKLNNKGFSVENIANTPGNIQVKKLFLRGYRGENNDKNGAGIGLAIVNELTRAHRWKIKAQASSDNKVKIEIVF